VRAGAAGAALGAGCAASAIDGRGERSQRSSDGTSTRGTNDAQRSQIRRGPPENG
jgi:hypothetical protein